MDSPTSHHLADLASRKRACEHCNAIFTTGRSDQRFCTDLCRLRRWRIRKSAPPPCSETGQQRLAALGANLDRLQAEITELRRLQSALQDALATCLCAQSSPSDHTLEPSDTTPRI